jgi:ankyrin repeat protein
MMIDASHTGETRLIPDAHWEGEERYSLHSSILTIRNRMGNTPLHVLCAKSAEVALLSVFLECTAKEACQTLQDTDDNKKCYQSNQTKRNTCDAASLPIPTPFDLVCIQNEHGCTPLHFIGEARCSFTAAKIMDRFCDRPLNHCEELENYNSCGSNESQSDTPTERSTANEECQSQMQHAVLIQDEDLETPLHYACVVGASPRRLKLLLRRCEAAVLIPNQFGALPIDQLIFDSDIDFGDSGSRIEVLLKAASSCLSPHEPELDADGRLLRPLHVASSIHLYPALVCQLMQAIYPDQISVADKFGMLPLHVASCWRVFDELDSEDENSKEDSEVDNHEFSLERWKYLPSDKEKDESLIRFLLEKYPQAASRKAKNGQLPLHFALESQRSWSDINALLSEAPNSISTRDPMSRLFPFMFAAAMDNDVAKIFNLLLSDPELIRDGIPS